MTTVKDVALRLAILTALRDLIDAEVLELRHETTEEMVDLHDAVGVKALDVTLPDGTPVASVSLSTRQPKLSVTNEATFKAWVEAAHPDETQTIVRPSFQKALLDRCIWEDEDIIVDPTTGEFPLGLGMAGGTSHGIRITYTKDTGRAAIAAAWRAGTIDGLPAIGELP